MFELKCICGKKVTAQLGNMRGKGTTHSCGCMKDRNTTLRNTTHNKSKLPVYPVWKAMKQRCLNKNDRSFKNYGGRGITVCRRWLKFENFYEDMGDSKKALSLDRINNDGNYEPTNCRWATRKQQAGNTRRSLINK